MASWRQNWQLDLPLMEQKSIATLQAFNSALKQSGLDARHRRDFPDDWSRVSDRVDYLPVKYSGTSIDYDSSYWIGNGVDFHDASLVLYYDKQPCAIWPLSVMGGERFTFGSCGGMLMAPVFDQRLALRSVKKVIAGCLEFADIFCRENSIPAWESRESFSAKSGFDEWHIQAMQLGAQASVRHDIFVDLSMDIAAIKNRFRKSYKSLITSGKQHFNVGLLDAEGDKKVWQEFRALHLAAAGRATRSEDSWDLQYLALTKGEIFLVHLSDHSGRMVGGALFHVTRDEGYYSVGAYDRDLFDKPIGHLIQYEAIEEMKRRGVRWYFIGGRPFPAEPPVLSEKQQAIVLFQNGFATHTFPRFIVTRKIESKPDELSTS